MTVLKVEFNGIKLEIDGLGPERTERALLGVFAHIDGGSFTEAYLNADYKEQITGIKKNYSPVVDGVRIIDGVKNYKCSYHCGCGEQGVRYVKEDTVVTSCHKCKQVLNVTGNLVDGVVTPDKYFNYYVAY